MTTTTTILRALNDSQDGMLVIPPGTRISEVGNPGWKGSETGKAVKFTITKWTDHGKDPLFKKGTLDVGDINQEKVGDCWYLAALVSILDHPKGSELLKRTMVDVGKGKVVVRLFDGELKPHYLQVQKSILWHSGSGKLHVSGIGKTGLWAAMLEKAACCVTQASQRKVIDPDSPNYANIEGGHGDHAYRMLLGVPTRAVAMAGLNQVGAPVGKTSATDHIGQLFATGNWGIMPEKDKGNLDALNAVFGWNKMSALQWQAILKDLQKRRSPLVVGAFKLTDPAGIANFLKLMQMPGATGLPQSIANELAAFAKKHSIASGDTGTGTYSAGALSLFGTIKNKLATRCMVSAGTVKDVGPVEGRGKSAGEEMSRGMVGKHAYAVLGTFEENVMLKRKWVKIANPWNTYGRGYSDAGLILTSQEQEAGAFWIELKDLCDVIDKLYYTEADPTPAA
jgi:hypothetical protein